MRGSGVNWPADVVPDTTARTGGSRMLLDELLAETGTRARLRPRRRRPVLSVDPIAVPPTVETGRQAVRQRLAELENAARRNYRSAEEARRVLADEHQRLEQELTARTHAQHEAAALRRELERLSTDETAARGPGTNDRPNGRRGPQIAERAQAVPGRARAGRPGAERAAGRAHGARRAARRVRHPAARGAGCAGRRCGSSSSARKRRGRSRSAACSARPRTPATAPRTR